MSVSIEVNTVTNDRKLFSMLDVGDLFYFADGVDVETQVCMKTDEGNAVFLEDGIEVIEVSETRKVIPFTGSVTLTSI